MNYLSNDFLADFHGTYIEKGKNSERFVSLTFDDGPGCQTEYLLALLTKLGVKATFFMVAEQVEQNKMLAKRIVESGHSVGMHGYTHKSTVNISASEFFNQQFKRCRRTFQRVLDITPKWYRPPYGEITIEQVRVLESEEIKLIGWSIDPWDWSNSEKDDHADIVTNKIITQLHPGAIILLHDNYYGLASKSKIVQIVGLLVPLLVAEQYRILTIDELIG